jgi:hypothetical protein
MSDAFQQICAEVERATRFLHTVQECRPQYQRVLDYIMTHPEERDSIASSLSGSLTGRSDAARASIYLVQFLMETLRWPEVRRAAEERFNDGGNAWYAHEIDSLLKVYG